MLTVKGKGNSTGHRYKPVSEFDNATLAQKREYWRNKKREQRARRAEKRRTTPKPNSVAHASSFPLQNKNGSNLAVNNADTLQIRTRTSSSFAALNCQKQQLHLNPSLNTSKTAVKCMPQENTINSVLMSQLNGSTSAPPFTKSHSVQPCVSVQGPLVPKTNQNPTATVFIQPKPTTNHAGVSSHCSTKSTPLLETKSALVIQQKLTNVSPAKAETEDEKAAKRRELWRIRKREQRARLAARLGKTKRAQNVQKPQSSNGASIHIPSQSFIQSGSLMKTQNLQTNMATSFQTAPPLVVVKRPFETIGKTPNPFHLSGVMRARCPTPRQNIIKQRRLKLNSPTMSYLSESKGPQIDPCDTPEQIIAKRREHWRLKKREQRAKLSADVKLKLKEKGDFQRRVKRYHKILEDMRKARSQTIMHASETIGGFIKEDGTVTINIPQVTVNFNMPAQRREQVDNIDSCSTQPQRSLQHLQPILSHPVPVKNYVSPFRLQPNKSRQILTDKPQTIACSSSQIVPTQTQGSHLMLTPASLNPGSTTGGCVMKMAVSCKALSPVKAYLDLSLTEEERMAKRREYWRVKKREQRAARTVRLRQGHSQARASAVLLKRKAQKHVAAVPLSKRFPKPSGSITNNNMAYANEMKQVSELMPTVDLNLNQAICPELKPPMSQTPPPAQVDPDPALSPDNQATTLLAVASMKKLLEESLSGVSESQPETGIKMEIEEEKVEQDMKPDVLLYNVCAPITADVQSQTESSHADTKIEHVSFEQKDMTPSTIPQCAPDDIPETPSFIVNPKIEASDCAPPQRRTLRTKKAGHQHCCSPGPPKLHHPPIERQTETEDRNPTRDKCPQVMTLEEKREYWKLMKRQQRARMKARQRSISNVVSYRTVQFSGCMLNKRSAIKPALLPKSSTQSGTATTGMPTVLLVSPTVANAGPQSTLRVKSPVCSRDPDTDSRRGNENTNVNSSVFPTIKPPDNPLSRMNIQPIEPSQLKLRSITIPCPPKQNNAQYVASRSIGTIVPPKPIPGESDEDFQKRKREYWRVKKKEQRARKAFQDKDKPPNPSCSQNLPQYMPQEPLQDQYEQESNEWMDSSVEPEDLINNSTDSDVGSFSFPSYSVPIDGVFTDYESPSGEDAALSGDFWRNHYLMDHDPLNQLLVCMVCGELQYVHSLEGVRGHIEEAHPHTLNLESGERHRILQAWDEQVFHRERFFTNQLQQHSTSTTEAHMN